MLKENLLSILAALGKVQVNAKDGRPDARLPRQSEGRR